MRQALLDAVTTEDMQAVVRQLIHQAREGDVAAARLVLAYSVGKPDKAVDPDTLDVQEFQLWQQHAVANEQLLGVLGRVQAGLANTILRAATPSIQEQTAQTLHQTMRDSIAATDQAAPAAREKTAEEGPSASRSLDPANTAAPEEKAAAGPQANSNRDGNGQRGRKAVSTHQPASDRSDTNTEKEELKEELNQEYERQFWPAFLHQLARLVVHPSRPEMTGSPPPPIANGGLTPRTMSHESPCPLQSFSRSPRER